MVTSEALCKIFYRPHEIFAELKQRPNWLVAACVLFGIVVASGAVVIESTDSALEKLRTEFFAEALKQEALEYERLIESETEDLSQHETSEIATETYTTTSFVAVGFGPSHPVIRELTAIVFFLLGLACEVVYFRLVSATMSLNLNVRHWMAFSIWSHIPAAVLAFAGVVLVSLSIASQSHPFDQANPINYEIFSAMRWVASPNTAQGGFSIFSIDIYHLDLALAWVLVLQTIGFREWSGKSILTSISVVAIPIAILYIVVMWLSSDHLFWYVTIDP